MAEKVNDEQLYQAIIDDNQIMITRFFESYTPEISALINTINKDKTIAKGIAVRSFYKLTEYIGRGGVVKTSVIALWKGYIRNISKEEYRLFSQPDISIIDITKAQNLYHKEESYDVIQKSKIIKEFIASKVEEVGSNCKELLHRFYVLEQTSKLIATELNVEASTIRQQIKRCKEKIKPTINPEDYKWILEN